MKRRSTTQVIIGNIGIGSDHPIAVQSMTNTPTADVAATLAQITELIDAGSELVRITINDDAAAQAAIHICQSLRDQGIITPIIGDFHFNGHLLLEKYADLAALLTKYRINPGNLGRGKTHDDHFAQIIKIAIANDKPIRIGVNSGSLDPELLENMMTDNAESSAPKSAEHVLNEAMIESALQSVAYAIKLGLPENKIIISAKTSDLQDLIAIYQSLAQRCSLPLHLGLTEAGSAEQGIISSTAAMAILLQQGIGDTIRTSLTPDDNHPRTKEVVVCRQILQSLGIRFFIPQIISCPGCGRTSSALFENLVTAVKAYLTKNISRWKKDHPGVERMTIAVMGCVVNGPGESKHADIGISLPNANEDPDAVPVYIRGTYHQTLKGKDIDQQFLRLIDEFIKTHY